ncbi:sulfur oxidation c-type cytochrome SoxX [Xanthobacter tagetidis]|uniref:Sulfur oxidation c-type cytochrome SoxX n=1 Tax=Xanthobacter tagetidis TaxID=60216 RepID=A0A3L7A200_9HYPH|nr:sulfur oxidation c-type cytochrome SoxX [Xanthobacter tagetidis]MBB6307213.1 sulfur-oxidizing protein SoxX [Xanthobacter tagetidis]RLP74050.1 sulfur oxidation c-type cytochrome SoxX [Xanthobacter tagetidis]
MRMTLAAALLAVLAAEAAAQTGAPAPALRYAVLGDTIAASLTGQPGDAARGAALMGERSRSLCALCHAGPFAAPHFAGDIGPSLDGVGARLSAAQIRLRVVDMRALNPNSPMPSFHQVPDAPRVAAAWRDRPVLTAAEVEDIVAYLSSLGG